MRHRRQQGARGAKGAAVRSAVALVAAALTIGAAGAEAPAPASTAEQAFALELLQRLGPGSANLVISPSSVASVLAMLEPGAAGATQAGIARAMQSAGVPAGRQAAQWHALALALRQRATQGGLALDTANALWLQQGFPVRPSYLALLAADFGTGVQKGDLQADPAGAAQAIDKWVAARTDGHITHLVAPAELADVVAVVVDAVYLNAPWQSPFDPSLTAPAPFHAAPGATTTVKMMSTGAPLYLPVTTGPGLDAAQLAYKGGQFSALVLMPPLGQLAGFERRLSVNSLASLVAAMRAQRADVELPRFQVNSALQLKDVLSAMGMGQSFTNAADFGNISPRPLQLSFIVHDAQVDVTESGTQASAATGGGIAPTAVAARPPLRIVFDHPFLFLVRDNTSGTVLFEAQVNDPS
jgi:serpin B